MRKGRATNGNRNATEPNISTSPTVERLAVSVGEFTEMFGLSKVSGYRLVKAGRVPVIDFNGRLVIPMRWIREQVENAKPRGGNTEA